MKFLFGVVVDSEQFGILLAKFFLGKSESNRTSTKVSVYNVFASFHRGAGYRCHGIWISIRVKIIINILTRHNPNTPDIFQQAIFNGFFKPNNLLTGLEFTYDGFKISFHFMSLLFQRAIQITSYYWNVYNNYTSTGKLCQVKDVLNSPCSYYIKLE